ncbi:flagellar protein FliT [Luminiphilus sp.]|nr:flagellar protein FliT [Luminiphilus sp.]
MMFRENSHDDAQGDQLTLTQTRLLADVIKQTREMLASARSEDWNTVAEMEIVRRETLRHCFESPMLEHCNEIVAEALAVILHLNEELVSELSAARGQTLEASLSSKKSLIAVNEYHNVGEGT